MHADVAHRPAQVLLYWLPLGAGGRFVRMNGRVYEAVLAWRAGRPAQDLYHSALEVFVDGHCYVVEMAPVWSEGGTDHGAVGEGPVGSVWLGRSALFRYEVRRWHRGVIPDVDEAVDSPRVVSGDPAAAREVLALVPAFPRLVWGRDEHGAGDMWNSNSLVSWLLARSGHDMATLGPPRHGRAPGWQAGLLAARDPGPAGRSVVAERPEAQGR